MSKTTRLFKSFYRLFLPVVVLVVLAIMVASVWFVHNSANPPKTAYLVTPEKYGQLSTRAAQVTDESWPNSDGTTSRGWLLRGAKGAPAVILLHRYGADRSYVLNLGVKMNELTNFTILMPDLRGHGENPSVQNTSFGGCEKQDTISAIGYLRSLKNPDKETLVGKDIGIYGVELGAMVGLSVAAGDQSVKALVLDSVPAQSSDLLASVVDRRYPFASFLTSKMARGGTYLYFAAGCYERQAACPLAKQLSGKKVMLLAGADAPHLQTSTSNLSSCFPKETKVKASTNLNPSGFGLVRASLEQADSYDQKVIYFFKEALGNAENAENAE
jgi:pimeloyl-ACP methyl ester carboxylesterase